MSVQWKTPPVWTRINQRDARIDADVTELKTQPGRWALVRTGTTDPSQMAYKRRGCEITVRRTHVDSAGHRVYDAYARWPEAHA